MRIIAWSSDVCSSDLVDFEEIARVIASGDARGRRTCLRGIDELIAGECIVIDRSHVSIEPWWTPWDHVDPPLEMEVADAAVRLRETITDCVGTWASCFSSDRKSTRLNSSH